VSRKNTTHDHPALYLEWESVDEGALEALAARVAGVLGPGDVVVLRGEVGSGKTTFVRAAARALGVRETVTSPTYQFARGYEGTVDGRGITLNHLDLYRLEGLDARDALDLDEYLAPDASRSSNGRIPRSSCWSGRASWSCRTRSPRRAGYASPGPPPPRPRRELKACWYWRSTPPPMP
jgi:tRNA threonylcarbamoyl adenosine modification protein YjeE